MSKPVQWAPPTPTCHAAETMTEWPLRVSARARCGSSPVSGRSVQNLAKVLTQGELFKLKRAGKLLIAREERSVPQTSPQSSGWGSGLLANCDRGLAGWRAKSPPEQ